MENVMYVGEKLSAGEKLVNKIHEDNDLWVADCEDTGDLSRKDLISQVNRLAYVVAELVSEYDKLDRKAKKLERRGRK